MAPGHRKVSVNAPTLLGRLANNGARIEDWAR
jgi:hypothetical protein